MPAIAAMPDLQTAIIGNQSHLQNLPPLKGRQGPISDPIFLQNKGTKANHMIQAQNDQNYMMRSNCSSEEPIQPQISYGVNAGMQVQHQQEGVEVSQDDPLDDVEFESGQEDATILSHAAQLIDADNLDGGVFNHGSTSIQDGVY